MRLIYQTQIKLSEKSWDFMEKGVIWLCRGKNAGKRIFGYFYMLCK